MSFDDIIGNDRIKNILRKSLQRERLPGSLLFYGPEGVGKKETALVLAKALNCLQKKDDSCEKCSSCEAVNKQIGTFPDVMRIQAEKETIQIDQIRLIKQAAYLRPMIGKKRVFIIEDAEKMNEEASNSLLKVLEEPPLFSHIILTTDNLFAILPTIKSRCQILKFTQISRQDVQKELIERGTDEEKAKIISLLVQGNLQKALEFDWEEVNDQRKKAFNIFSSFLKGGKTAAFFKKYSRMQKKNFSEEFKPLLEMISSFCRDLILLKIGSPVMFLINPDYKDKLSKIEETMSLNQSLRFLRVIEDCIKLLESNINRKVIMNSMAINLMDRENV
ncbi:MAG: DNA polymerase III subunit delta' [Candidatus Aminicenantes bacterium]